MIPDELKHLDLRPHPHLVILGAGASRATTPEGELNRRTTPLMKDLPYALELRSILDVDEFEKACDDFEAFFDQLMKTERRDLQDEIERRAFDYFDGFKISTSVTLYDRLVLSLRRKDVIATFNWDPLLPYAYRRSGYLHTLPALLFLHGNVQSGWCNDHKRLGWTDDVCDTCRKLLAHVRLLYPVSHKDYASDPVIAEHWSHLD